MKQLTYIFLGLFTLVAPRLMAEEPAKLTTEGTEFYVVFLSNGHSKAANTLDLMLYFSGRQDATVTITNPNNSSWSGATVTVAKNTLGTYSIPKDHRDKAYIRYASSNVENISLLVKSTTPISLYAVDAFIESTGATAVMPTSVLGTDYMLQSYDANFDNAYWKKSSVRQYSGQFAVVATEDNTTVEITPTIALQDGRPANQTFPITLAKKGQSYFCRGNYETDQSICGTTIQANKPVAVFQGNSGGTVPKHEDGSDHMYEMAAPTCMLGDTFGIAKVSINYDLIRLTALENNTEIYVDGAKLATLNAKKTYEYKLSGTDCFITTSKPVACNSFLSGAGVNCIGEYKKDSIGDPAMIINPPLEQMIDTITFATTTPQNIGANSSQIKDYYVSIVTRAEAKGKIKLDGTTIAATQYSTFTGNSKYVYTRQKVAKGSHTLTGDGEAFMATVYCIGKKEAYAYNAGCGVKLLYDTIRIPNSDTVCYADRPYSWRGKQLYTDTVCSDTIHHTVGLRNTDTIYTITLKVSDPIRIAEPKDTVVCDTLLPYTWYGHVFYKADTITDTLPSMVFAPCDSLQRTFQLTTYPPVLCYDSLVYRKWGDVLFCANGNKQIVAYQWYKDSEAIVGETSQYLYCTQGFDGVSAYYVKATYADGSVIETCPKVFEKTPASAATYVKMNTNIRRGSALRIEMSDMEAEVKIFTMLGQLVMQKVIYSSVAQLPIELPSGVYMVNVKGVNVKETVKIQVN